MPLSSDGIAMCQTRGVEAQAVGDACRYMPVEAI